MNEDPPRWGVIGVAFTVVTAITSFILVIISISDAQIRWIAIIISFIAIISLIAIYWLLRTVMKVVYQVITDITVISIDEEVKGKVQILYNSKPIDDARLIVLRIRNLGVSIPTSEYESPFIFTIEDAEILDVTVLETMPSTIKDQISVDVSSNKVILKPLLLNKKDSIKLKFIVAKSQKEIKIDVRIKGLREIRSIDAINRKRLEVLEKIDKFLIPLLFYSYSILFGGNIIYGYIYGYYYHLKYLSLIIDSVTLPFDILLVLTSVLSTLIVAITLPYTRFLRSMEVEKRKKP